jgi:hypothetical protein
MAVVGLEMHSEAPESTNNLLERLFLRSGHCALSELSSQEGSYVNFLRGIEEPNNLWARST